MKFKAKNLNISGGGFYIVVINEKTAGLEDFHVSSRVKVISDHKSIIAIVDLADESVVKRDEVGLFNEVSKHLKIKSSKEVNIIPLVQPMSVHHIKKKLDGLELNQREINSIIRDVVNNNLSQIEMSAFITACYTRGLSMNETYYLTKSVVNNGKTIKFGKPPIVDKHCVGGISGNRTTMIMVPLIAAAGLKIPKTSSRSITSPAGTADVMEVLAPVNLSINTIRKTVNQAGGCIAWGGSMNLAAADDKLISIRHPLALDPLGLMLASIMAKKKAVGSTHVIIDIPVGAGAKTKTIGEAKLLGLKFEELSKRLSINVQVVYTDGSKPIGRGIGPVLEARDCLWVLGNDERGPNDLREKALNLTASLLELSGKVSPGEGYSFAKKLLESGAGLKKFKQIIKLQGGDPNVNPDNLKLGKYSHKVLASRSGLIKFLNDDLIARIAKMAGAPLDKEAGVYIHKNAGEFVNKSEPVITIYSENESLLASAVDQLDNKLMIIG